MIYFCGCRLYLSSKVLSVSFFLSSVGLLSSFLSSVILFAVFSIFVVELLLVPKLGTPFSDMVRKGVEVGAFVYP